MQSSFEMERLGAACHTDWRWVDGGWHVTATRMERHGNGMSRRLGLKGMSTVGHIGWDWAGMVWRVILVGMGLIRRGLDSHIGRDWKGACQNGMSGLDSGGHIGLVWFEMIRLGLIRPVTICVIGRSTAAPPGSGSVYRGPGIRTSGSPLRSP